MSKELEKPDKENKVGRPTLYSEELIDEICERISGGDSLKDICAEDGMPKRTTVFRWLAKYEEFRNLYARAREEQADLIFDEVKEIADSCGRERDETGKYIPEQVAKARLQADVRKWQAAKLRPKVYGDRIDHTSSDGSMRPSIIRQIIVDSTITEDE